MKRSASVAVLVVALLFIASVPGSAWAHGFRGRPAVGARVVLGFGPLFWWPHPAWYYPPHYVYTPPAVVVQQPPVYVQQPPPPPPPPPAAYWYYCASAKAYYPNVQACPEPWIKVPPRPE
ncbi:MAG: hypothetical protein HYU51_08445 [Candidatus Rokubacteria bacterium]|nr:hypothetical protein [Candidatus Rokubacteria bacterium]